MRVIEHRWFPAIMATLLTILLIGLLTTFNPTGPEITITEVNLDTVTFGR